MTDRDGPGALTRRRLLRDGAAVTVAVMAAGPASLAGDIAVAVDRRRRSFLDPSEMKALGGLVDRFVPGRPEDADEGAVAAGCAEAIDALLGAFRFSPPRIYAGAPFSDRAGSRVNHFERFLGLDAYEEMGWRLRIEGSRGKRRLEFNGPHRGWQQVYRDGLAALDRASRGGSFGDLSGIERDLVLRSAGDDAIAELIDVAFPHTWQLMYGAPEYGGNRELLGWDYSRYAGDVQPRGWTRAEIEAPPQPSGSSPRPDAVERALANAAVRAIAPLAFPEAAHHIVARSGDSLSAMRAEIAPLIDWARRAGDGA